MLARSIRNPLLIGAGALAVLITGGASAVLAQPTPPPSTSTPAPIGTLAPEPPVSVALKRTDTAKIHAGSEVPVSADITVNDLKSFPPGTNPAVWFTAEGDAATTTSADHRCPTVTITKCTFDRRSVVEHAAMHIVLNVTVKIASGTVTIDAVTPSSDGTSTEPLDRLTLTVTAPDGNGSPPSTPSTPPRNEGSADNGSNTHHSSANNHSSASHSSSHSGSSGPSGSGGSAGDVPTPPLNPPGAPSGVAPSTAPSPGAVLPSIPQAPSTAPSPPVLNTGSSQSMRGKAAGPDELTFGKLASMQAAWLAALLVAFSLLLTQVRLGKTTNRASRLAGAHRRLRRRVRHTRAH